MGLLRATLSCCRRCILICVCSLWPMVHLPFYSFFFFFFCICAFMQIVLDKHFQKGFLPMCVCLQNLRNLWLCVVHPFFICPSVGRATRRLWRNGGGSTAWSTWWNPACCSSTCHASGSTSSARLLSLDPSPTTTSFALTVVRSCFSPATASLPQTSKS